MRTTTHILQYTLAALTVIVIGGLVGWYVFVQKEITGTEASDTARGFGVAALFGSPTGSSYANSSGSFGEEVTGVQASSTGNVAPRLWKVTAVPVAGFGFAASSTLLHFAERSSGNVLLANPFNSSVVRLTNTLFPKIYEALFASDGSVILRSLTDTGIITTYAGTIASSTVIGEPVALQGVYLPQNISALAVRSPQQIFFLVSDPQSGTAGVTSTWTGSSQKPVFASALSGWRIWWLADGTMYVSQKASDDVTGYSFTVQGGTTRALVSGPGLTVLPRVRSAALLYSTSSGGQVSLYARASADSSAIRLPIRTISEKCVWAPGENLIAYCAVPVSAPATNSYLYERYRGTLHTSDIWWRVDVSAGTAESLYAPNVSVEIDVENPTIDQSGEYIAFTNGIDKSLWMLRVTQ